MAQVETGFSPLAKLRAFQMVAREWLPHFSAAEFTFLIYLLDRTVSWDRETFTCTVDQMVTGMNSVPPIGMSRRSVFYLIKTLRDRGVIRADANGRATTFAVNLRWEPEMPIIPVPKKKQQVASDEKVVRLDDFREENSVQNLHSGSANSAPEKCKTCTPYISNQKPVTEESNHHARERTRETVEEALARTKAKAPTGTDKPKSLRTVWEDAWRTTFTADACPSWSKIDKALVKKIADRLTSASIDPDEFFHSVVCRWNRIVRSRFAWMKQSPPPSMPSIRFLMRFIDEFMEGYLALRLEEADATDFTRDAFIDKQVRAGKTREEALIEWGRNNAIGAQRKEIEAKERMLNKMLANAEKRANVPPPPTRERPAPMKAEVRHGDNPYDREDFEFKGLDVGEWEE